MNNCKNVEFEDKQRRQEYFRALVGAESLLVCLPKQYATDLGLRKGEFVRVTQEDEKIVIEKAADSAASLR